MAMYGNVTDDLESVMISNNSSPLRRRSELFQVSATAVLPENNDEIERRERRQEIKISNLAHKNSSSSNRRASLGLSALSNMSMPQMAERITQCIKLNTENKINVKNAFNLQIIDFMTYMIKKQDSNMSNLQVASTSLDVSTKIYAYRVDGVHTDILKMVGGLEKQDEDQNVSQTDETEDCNGGKEYLSKKLVKERRKKQQKIINTISMLKRNIEICKPSLTIMKEDAQTTDTLCQVLYPIHANSGYYLHGFNDIIVDSVDNTGIQDNDSKCTIPQIEQFSQLDICPPLASFEFHNWSEDIEPNEAIANHEPNEELQFDLDASLPQDDEPPRYDLNYLNADSEEERISNAKDTPEIQNIVDFRDVVTATSNSTKVSEYSILQNGLNLHWAGPSHWKINRYNRSLVNSKIIEACPQGPTRKRKHIELVYDSEKMEAVKLKFIQGQAVKFHSRTTKNDWAEEYLTLPNDMHYNIVQATKLYLHKLFIMQENAKNDPNSTHFAEDFDHYDYNNENDISNYCPNAVQEDYEPGNENECGLPEDPTEHEAPAALTGGNLVVAPKLANKIAIAYSVRAKRIDMRQLKRSIWKNLTSSYNKENINIQEAVEEAQANKLKEEKLFSEVSKTLPSMLSKSNAEALSFPISFVSLLHLANEKSLKISSLPDMSDIIVTGS